MHSGVPTLATGALAGLGPFFAGAGADSGLQTMSAGLLDYNNGVANANYHGGTLTVIERGKYLSLTANYTYSHTIDNGNFTTFINLPVNQFDYKAERANSNQDGRHRFVANFSATGPIAASPGTSFSAASLPHNPGGPSRFSMAPVP